MSYLWYVAAFAIALIAIAFFYGIWRYKRGLKKAWTKLADAFDGARVPRVMDFAPKGAADRLDFGEAQFLGYVQLIEDALRFYWYKIGDGAVITVPTSWIASSKRKEGHHEPAAVIFIETPDKRRFEIVVSVPEELCERITRLGQSG